MHILGKIFSGMNSPVIMEDSAESKTHSTAMTELKCNSRSSAAQVSRAVGGDAVDMRVQFQSRGSLLETLHVLRGAGLSVPFKLLCETHSLKDDSKFRIQCEPHPKIGSNLTSKMDHRKCISHLLGRCLKSQNTVDGV